ncbi:MAG: 16S rRNA processing protein RimM [Deltaproteobacteria bacterium]|nr:16S rRNA processing protein RimM [Deltaproteobacteria bacterium]
MTGSGYLPIGTITRPHGLRGLLKVRMDAGSRENLQPGSRVRLSGEGPFREAVLEEIKDQGPVCLVRFAEVRDREAAEALVGWSIHVEAASLPVLADDEYYWYEVVGSKVFDEEDRYLGILEEIFSTPAHDIWVARAGEKEYLIPAVAEVVLAVDRVKKTVQVQNLKELWEVDGC